MAETQLSHSQIFGRKIFFVCATFTLNSSVILRLLEQEYEVYRIDDFHQVKSLLKLHPDAIVYINTDSTNPLNIWFNYIYYYENDPLYKDVSWGVFASGMKSTDKEKFEKELTLKAGLFPDNKDYAEIMAKLMTNLTDLKAKGLRQFVRISLSDNQTAMAFYINSNRMFKMKLLDISSIGCGIKIPAKDAYLAKTNTVIQGLSLVLGSKQLECNAIVRGIKIESDGIVAVCIFTPETPDSFRSYIRSFIRDELHKSLMAKAISLPWDKTDYSIPVKAENIEEAELTEQEKKEAVEKAAEANSAESEKLGEQVEKEQQEAKAEAENLESLEEVDEAESAGEDTSATEEK